MRVIGGFARFYASMVQICSGNFPDHADIFLSLDFLDTFLNYPDTFRIVQKFSRSPRHICRSSVLFLDYSDTFSRLTGHFQDHPESFRLSRHTSRSSRLFFNYPDKFSRLSGHFEDRPETFQFIRTLCIISGYFVLQSIWKFFSQ